MIERLASADEVPEMGVPEAASRGNARALRRSLGSVRAALAVLTRIPVADPGLVTGAPAFGLVGALIGVAGAIPILAVGDAVPSIGAILAVAAMAGLSGAIHLDGLADTADALVAIGPDASERARTDPAVGAAGAVTLILVIAVDVAALTAVLTGAGSILAALACVVAAATSRAVPPAVARLASKSVMTTGLAAWFAARITATDVVIALATAAATALAAALGTGRAELAIAASAAVAIGIGASIGLARVRKGVDGDLLGAGVELAQAGCLVVVAVLVSWPR